MRSEQEIMNAQYLPAAYTAGYVSTIGANVSADMLIVTGGNKDLGLMFKFNSDTNFDVFFYENPSISATSVATILSGMSFNRNLGTMGTATVYRAPSVISVSAGTQVLNSLIPDGATYLNDYSLGLPREAKFILQRSQNYLARVINNASADRTFVLQASIYEI